MAFISCRNATRVALITAALGVPATLSAQKTVFKSGVDMVPLTVTVTDTKGRYVTGLTGADFEVFEDGVQQDVAFFASDGVPLDVALLVDTSGSMDGDLPLVKSAATGLVGKLRTTDRATVVDVKGSTSIVQELTSDRTSIARAIHGLSAGGETAIYDAVYVILRELERERRTAAQVRRQALVLLTDGIDTRSRLAFEDVLDVARRGNVSIYVVALKSALAQTPRSRLPGAILRSDYALKSVTRECGGRLFEPKTAVDLPRIYSAIAEELFSQYQTSDICRCGRLGTATSDASWSDCDRRRMPWRALEPATSRRAPEPRWRVERHHITRGGTDVRPKASYVGRLPSRSRQPVTGFSDCPRIAGRQPFELRRTGRRRRGAEGRPRGEDGRPHTVDGGDETVGFSEDT